MRSALLCFTLVASTLFGQSFVQRSGTHLVLDNTTFRFSGPNIEWLGLEGYGPHDPFGPRYPSHFEIDDAFATAAEMGAKVVRSQTMGDTIGCSRCIEPEEGQFNQSVFQASDYALSIAARYHMKVIITLIGDCATFYCGGLGQYLAWLIKQPHLALSITWCGKEFRLVHGRSCTPILSQSSISIVHCRQQDETLIKGSPGSHNRLAVIEEYRDR